MEKRNNDLVKHICEHVMGWNIGDPAGLGVPAWFRPDGTCAASFGWNPETSWADAGLVLDKMREMGYAGGIIADGKGYWAEFIRRGGTAKYGDNAVRAIATGPAAITMAAARATGYTEK